MSDLEPGPSWLTRPDGIRLALRHDPGAGQDQAPAVVFLHGLKSDMRGTKAAAIASMAVERGWECLRLDLSGHGDSEGAFEDCTVTGWVLDAQAALDRLCGRPAVLVGSSLGGWIALRLALLRPRQVAGLLLIAPAVDMTRRVWTAMTPDERETLRSTGVWQRPSRWSGPIAITKAMFEDGERHCLLVDRGLLDRGLLVDRGLLDRGLPDRAIPLDCPVRILHGQNDTEVPWQGSLELADRLAARDVRVTLIKNGDHRLSEPAEIGLLTRTLADLRDICRARESSPSSH